MGYSSPVTHQGVKRLGMRSLHPTRVSDEEIASPVASHPDVLLAMNSPSIFAFISRLEPGGELLYNSDLATNIPERGDIELFAVPANRIARELGNERSANMVMLGSLVKLIEIVRLDTVSSSVEMMMGGRKKLVEISLRAIRAGFEGFPFSIN